MTHPVVPMFDALAHPTLSGDWHGRGVDATFDTLVSDLASDGWLGACAVGLHGVEGFETERFAAACAEHPSLVPIAGVRPGTPAAALRSLVELGYAGIKIHPRYACDDLSDPEPVAATMRAASDVGLVSFLCTYLWAPVGRMADVEPMTAVLRVLKRAPEARTVLVHGGAVDVLRFAELTRHNPHLLLDLSLTLMKYAGSSVDEDLRFLFRWFDRRICIGTDHPEYGHAAVRARFEALTVGVAEDKVHHAAHHNIRSFLGRT